MNAFLVDATVVNKTLITLSDFSTCAPAVGPNIKLLHFFTNMYASKMGKITDQTLLFSTVVHSSPKVKLAMITAFYY